MFNFFRRHIVLWMWNPHNHIHIWQVSPQPSVEYDNDTCLVANDFIIIKMLKLWNCGNRCSCPHPKDVCLLWSNIALSGDLVTTQPCFGLVWYYMILHTALLWQQSGPWFNITMLSYQYRKFHHGDKMIIRSSYLLNGVSYFDNTASIS